MREVKFVRFPGRYALQSPVSEKPSENGGLFPGQVKRTGNSLSENIRKGFGRGFDAIKSITRLVRPDSLKDSSTDLDARRKVFDPQGIFLQRWNKIFVLSCIFAISVDPLFFYIPFINSQRKCLDLDSRLEIIASVLRFFTDAFYILHIFFQFNTGFIAPSSRVFGRGILVEDYRQIALRYLSTYFLIDILAVLPLPQVFILIIVPKLKGPHSLREKNILRFLIIVQYIPRIWRIIPLYKEVRRTSGIITETAWLGAALNLFLYMLASHIIGAFWYLLAIERQDTCWRKSCNSTDCLKSLYCLKGDSSNLARYKTILDSGCPINPTDNQQFNFGMYLSALDSGIVNSTDFPEKFFYCFWWGLQNLSSLGQNLKTSTYVWEIAFAVFISISGLVLFSLLIGNMQTYLQSTTLRLEEMRVKRRDAEQWMSHRLLPENLRERIRRYEQYRWQETRGVNEDILLRNLPKDLRRDIKRHLCLSLLMKVPLFEKMDEQLLDAMCDRLVTTLFTEGSYVVREGDPVDEMLFIIRGKLESATTNGGRTGFLNSDLLIANNFCGDELLTWALVPQSTSNLPISTRTVKALTEVEAFALKADDLKFVATQFRRLHSKQLRHTFRFYSPQWKTWAAGFIQAAWRRYVRKKMDDALHVEEEKLQSSLVKDATFSTSLGVTIYASRFASNALKLIKHGGARRARVPERMPPIMLPKPEEPDFSVIDGN